MKLFFFLLLAQAHPVQKASTKIAHIHNLPLDTITGIINFQNFLDATTFACIASIEDILKNHAAHDNQVLELLCKNLISLTSNQLKILGENPTINILKLLEFIIKNDMDKESINLQYHADISLFLASKYGKLKLLKYLIHHVNVNPRSRGDLAFLLACQEGKSEIFNYLLEKVEPMHLALLLASQNGHYDIVSRLLEYGNIDPTTDGYSAAREAIKNGFNDILDLFLMDDRTDREEFSLIVRPSVKHTLFGIFRMIFTIGLLVSASKFVLDE